MTRLNLIIFSVIMLSSCIRHKFDERDYFLTIESIKKEIIQLDCDNIYRHTLNLNFSFIGFDADSMEIVLTNNYKTLYKGFNHKNIKLPYIESCIEDNLTDLEVFYIILLDHKEKKAYQFHKKETYISSTLNDERFLLFPDGTYKMVHNNWFWNTFF